MKPLKRYCETGWRDDYELCEDLEGEWVRYSDVQAYIKELIETISIPWNIMLTSGGALNEENSIDESKV